MTATLPPVCIPLPINMLPHPPSSRRPPFAANTNEALGQSQLHGALGSLGFAVREAEACSTHNESLCSIVCSTGCETELLSVPCAHIVGRQTVAHTSDLTASTNIPSRMCQAQSHSAGDRCGPPQSTLGTGSLPAQGDPASPVRMILKHCMCATAIKFF